VERGLLPLPKKATGCSSSKFVATEYGESVMCLSLCVWLQYWSIAAYLQDESTDTGPALVKLNT